MQYLLNSDLTVGFGHSMDGARLYCFCGFEFSTQPVVLGGCFLWLARRSRVVFDGVCGVSRIVVT